MKNETEDYLIHVKRRTTEVYADKPDISIKIIDGKDKENILLVKNFIPRNLGKAEITVLFE